jgi:hypothetical protein
MIEFLQQQLNQKTIKPMGATGFSGSNYTNYSNYQRPTTYTSNVNNR